MWVPGGEKEPERPGLASAHERARREDLEGHRPPERLLLRFVNDPHAASAQLADDPVFPNALGQRLLAFPRLRGDRSRGGPDLAHPAFSQRPQDRQEPLELLPDRRGKRLDLLRRRRRALAVAL